MHRQAHKACGRRDQARLRLLKHAALAMHAPVGQYVWQGVCSAATQVRQAQGCVHNLSPPSEMQVQAVLTLHSQRGSWCGLWMHWCSKCTACYSKPVLAVVNSLQPHGEMPVAFRPASLHDQLLVKHQHYPRTSPHGQRQLAATTTCINLQPPCNRMNGTHHARMNR